MQNNNSTNQNPAVSVDFVRQIVDKINKSENILVALSKDPSVDELAAALGLTLYLDAMQKHATAIYSGKTPDVLQFLQPNETFEINTDSLQDFIIALNKEKADHLRYKLDGDFVKVFITPYKTTITEDDLEFSRGDYNVDLVLALGVKTADDLDVALAEHGRIMHDATTIDITCEEPGKFGEIEWSDPAASSVSEMAAKLLDALRKKGPTVDPSVATAFLTGIVAATKRFSNEKTSPAAMQQASQLMILGADQQLVAMHVTNDEMIKEETYKEETPKEEAPMQKTTNEEDRTTLRVDHDEVAAAKAAAERAKAERTEIPAIQPEIVQPEAIEPEVVKPEAGGISQPEATPSMPPELASAAAEISSFVPPAVEDMSGEEPPVLPRVADLVSPSETPVVEEPKILEPKDYGKMLEQALAEPLPVETAASAAGMLRDLPQQPVADVMPAPLPELPPTPEEVIAAAASVPEETIAAGASVPEVPVLEPSERPEAVVLPPPPAPELGNDMMPPVLPPVMPEPNTESIDTQPATMENVAGSSPIANSATPPTNSNSVSSTTSPTPGAFQIPGM